MKLKIAILCVLMLLCTPLIYAIEEDDSNAGAGGSSGGYDSFNCPIGSMIIDGSCSGGYDPEKYPPPSPAICVQQDGSVCNIEPCDCWDPYEEPKPVKEIIPLMKEPAQLPNLYRSEYSIAICMQRDGSTCFSEPCDCGDHININDTILLLEEPAQIIEIMPEFVEPIVIADPLLILVIKPNITESIMIGEPILLEFPEEQALEEQVDIKQIELPEPWVFLDHEEIDFDNYIVHMPNTDLGICVEIEHPDYTETRCPVYLEPIVTCDEWGECIDGIQTRECSIIHIELINQPNIIQTERRECEMPITIYDPSIYNPDNCPPGSFGVDEFPSVPTGLFFPPLPQREEEYAGKLTSWGYDVKCTKHDDVGRAIIVTTSNDEISPVSFMLATAIMLFKNKDGCYSINFDSIINCDVDADSYDEELCSCPFSDNNKGHGNDPDGCDEDNPGKSCGKGQKLGLYKDKKK